MMDCQGGIFFEFRTIPARQEAPGEGEAVSCIAWKEYQDVVMHEKTRQAKNRSGRERSATQAELLIAASFRT